MGEGVYVDPLRIGWVRRQTLSAMASSKEGAIEFKEFRAGRNDCMGGAVVLGLTRNSPRAIMAPRDQKGRQDIGTCAKDKTGYQLM